MQIIPFTTQVVDIRVVDSKIGQVVPVVDIARAIDYDYNSLKGMLERNSELFEGTLVSVTLTVVQDNRGTEQRRNLEVKALNSYGVFGILMKLDYNRVKSEEKKQAVIRFQRWAMQVLGNEVKKEQYRSTGKEITYTKHVDKLPILPLDYTDKTYTMKEFSEIVERCSNVITREMERGNVHPYKTHHPRRGWKYAFTEANIKEFNSRTRKMPNGRRANRNGGSK